MTTLVPITEETATLSRDEIIYGDLNSVGVVSIDATTSSLKSTINTVQGAIGKLEIESSVDGVINGVVTEIKPQGDIHITTNGNYDVTSYSSASVNVSGTYKAQEKQVTPTKYSQNVTADTGYDTLSKVVVNAIPEDYIIPTGTISVTANGTLDISSYSSAYVNVPSKTPTLQTKSVIPNKTQQSVSADSGYDGLSTVEVSPIPNDYVIPEGTFYASANGEFNISSYNSVSIDVPQTTIRTQSKTTTPTKQIQNIMADSGYNALSKVTINPIPDDYIIPSGEYTIDTNGSYTVKQYDSVSVNVPEREIKTQELWALPVKQERVILPDTGIDGFSKVTIAAIPDQYIEPMGTYNVIQNGEYDIKSYEKVNVNVEGGGGGSGDTTALIWGGKNPVLVDTKTLTINIANDTTFSSITPSTTNQQILATSLSQYTQVSPSLDIKNYDYVVVFDVICKPTYTTAPTVSYTDTESKKVIYQISRRASNTYLTRVVNTINVSGEYNSSIWWRNGTTKYYSGMVLYGITLNHTTPTLSNANADAITINYLNPKLGVQNNTYGQEPGAWDTFDASSTNVYMRWQTYRVDKDSVAGEAYEQVKSMNDSLTFPDNTVTIQNMLDVSYDSTTGVLTINDSVR